MEFLTFRVSETCKFRLSPGPCMFHSLESPEPFSSLWLEEVATQHLLHLSVPNLCSLILYPASLPGESARVHQPVSAPIVKNSDLEQQRLQMAISKTKGMH